MMPSGCVFPIWGSHSCITGITINKHQGGKQLYICASLYSLQPCVSMLVCYSNSLADSLCFLWFCQGGSGEAKSELFLPPSSLHSPLRRCPNSEEGYKIWNNILIWLLLLEMASDQGWTVEMKRWGSTGWSYIHRSCLGNLYAQTRIFIYDTTCIFQWPHQSSGLL